ncbi:MAG TPA: cytochrome c oxidase assembly protein [Rhodocyclaceae bacterium]|nr:cytochrome c oxidase assembly protein [Rhodocyclaceae bacterium]
MDKQPDLAVANRRLVWKLLWIVAAASVFGFALVPLYNVLCAATGLNGKSSLRADTVPENTAATVVDRSRKVTIEFMNTTMAGLPWDIHPAQTHMDVHPGEPNTATYVVRNVSKQTIVGQAVPSISPGQAAQHFQKLECFCFTQQSLQPGEEKIMPLTFIVSPKLQQDIGTITLSYAFFDTAANNIKR